MFDVSDLLRRISEINDFGLSFWQVSNENPKHISSSYFLAFLGVEGCYVFRALFA